MTNAAPLRRCPMCAQPEHGSLACGTVTPTLYGPCFPPLPAITAVPPLRLCPCGRRDEHDHPPPNKTIAAYEKAVREELVAIVKSIESRGMVMLATCIGEEVDIDALLERAKARLGP